MSNPWSDTTKRWVVLALLGAGAMLAYRIRNLLPPFILASLLSYILNPVVEALKGLRLSRTKATIVTYVLLLIAAGVATSILVPMVLQQLSAINVDLLAIYQGIMDFASQHQTVNIRDYTIELSDVFDRLEDSLIQLVTGYASRSAEELVDIAFGVASRFASTFVWLIFILIVSFWLTREADEIANLVEGLIPTEYQDELEGLRRKIAVVWNSFFRGLLLLSFSVGAITTVAIWLVGVKNALLLGILAGVMEVVPSFGPIIACIPAVAVAFFQGSTHLPIANGWFALLVLGLYVVIQQVENNFLAPRIIGSSVRIHPLVILVGAIGGYSVGGILGAFLAAPIIGTSRVLGEYIYGKLAQVQPTPKVSEEAETAGAETESALEEAVAAEQDSESS